MTFQKFRLQTPDGWHLECLSSAPATVRHSSPILCLHGFSQNHRTWTEGPFVRTLNDWGHHVYVLDLRGHGGSQQCLSTSSTTVFDWDLSGYRVDVATAVDWILERHPGESIVLCGHSLGGVLSIAEALKRGCRRIHSLVSIAAPMDLSKTSLRLRIASRLLLQALPILEKQGVPWRQLPMDRFFQLYDAVFFSLPSGPGSWLPKLAQWNQHHWLMPMWDPKHMEVSSIRDMLQNSHAEPMQVVAQLAQSVQTGECRLGDKSAPDLNKRVQDLRIPVLSVTGMDDFIAPPATCEDFFQGLQCPKQRLVLARTHHIDITAGQPANQILQRMRHWLLSS